MSDPEPTPEDDPNVSSTSRMIRDMETKVSAQWKKAKGKVLSFSAGFSFRRGLPKTGEEGEEPKEIGRARPTRQLERDEQDGRRKVKLVVLVVVLTLVVVAAVIAYSSSGTQTVSPDALF